MRFTNILYIIHYILYRYILMRVIKAEMSTLPACRCRHLITNILIRIINYIYKDHKISF